MQEEKIAKVAFKLFGLEVLIKLMGTLIAILFVLYKPFFKQLAKLWKKRSGEKSFQTAQDICLRLTNTSASLSLDVITSKAMETLTHIIFSKILKFDKDFGEQLQDEKDGYPVREMLKYRHDYEIKQRLISEFFKVQKQTDDFDINRDAQCHYRISIYKNLADHSWQAEPLTYSETERGYLYAIDTAIALYEESGDFRYYSRFCAALNAYTQWLHRKIHLVNLTIRHLRRIEVRKGLVIDFREKIRTIMRFLFKNLDDEHGSVNNTYQTTMRFYYWLTRNYHENKLYRTSY